MLSDVYYIFFLLFQCDSEGDDDKVSCLLVVLFHNFTFIAL